VVIQGANVSIHAPSPVQVRAALEELLGWSELARSPQLAKFLKHIVEARLNGDEASIKAYSIAVDVFGRPADFDPQADPIVRVQARRLRGLLQEFYRQDLSRTGTRITLPVGRYVPEFELTGTESALSDAQVDSAAGGFGLRSPPHPSAPQQRFGRRFWVQMGAALALVLVLVSLLLVMQLREPAPVSAPSDLPGEPTVYVAAFSNLTGMSTLDSFAGRLDDLIVSVLAQFEDVQVGFIEPDRSPRKVAGAYLLSGTVAMAGSGIEVAAVLTDVVTGAAVWNQSMSQPAPTVGNDAVASNVARKIMREVGAFRGPIHAIGRRWLDANAPQIPAVNGYVCLLTYRLARESLNPAAIAKSLDCHERLLKQQPDLPLALAAKAWLEGRVIYASAGESDRLDVALADALALANRARMLAPESSFAHEQLANVQNWQENYAPAQRNFAIALGFEPLNTDARAGYAITLARVGDWITAKNEAQFAIADAAYPSPWYYYLPAVAALRDDRLEQAIRDGRLAAQSGELGPIVALAAAGLARDAKIVGELQPLIMSMENLRRRGIMPWVHIRIKDTIVREKISAGLRAGGVPEMALTAQF
jgi:TolB-like protein